MAESTKTKAIKGTAWTLFERLATQVCQFAIGIFLARILAPSDYGTVGMLAIFMAIAQSLIDGGFVRALIQKKGRTDIDYSTVFYFNFAISIILYAILFFSAPYIANFYRTPILKDVTRVVSLQILINALTIVQTAKLTIELNMKLQSIATIVSTVLSGLLGLLLAYNGHGVWALVWSGIASALVRMVILWIFSRWRPLLLFSKDSFKAMFSFGSKLLLGDFIHTITTNLYTLVIGRAFNATQVGYYNRANGYAVLPFGIFSQVVNKIIFPILSEHQDDNEKLLATYRRMVNIPMFIYVPLMAGFAALAKPLVVALITDKWLVCVPLIQILCVGYIISPLSSINLNLLYVKGRSDISLKLDFVKKPVTILLLLVSIPFGVWWICFGKMVYEFFAFYLNCIYTKKLLNYGFWKQIKDLLPIFVYSAIMFGVIMLAIMPFDNDWAKIGVGFVAGVVSYLVVAWIAKDSSLKEILQIAKEKIHK